MAELVDALVSGTSVRKYVQVRVLFWALNKPLGVSPGGFFYWNPSPNLKLNLSGVLLALIQVADLFVYVYRYLVVVSQHVINCAILLKVPRSVLIAFQNLL